MSASELFNNGFIHGLDRLFLSVKGVKINYLTPLLCSFIISSVMEKIVRQ